MGKRYLVVVFLVFSGLFAFADTNKQEEVDFLLFLPNSAEDFVDEGRAMIQLDTISRYILGKNPNPGQIYIYGYTANVENDIDSLNLSKARALFVMYELQKRGVARELFSDPVAYGGVDLWGSNENEEDRVPNRRVRIVLDGAVLTPAVVTPVEPVAVPVEPEIKITNADDGSNDKRENVKEKSGSKFPWIILLLLLAFAILPFLLSKRKKKSEIQKPIPPADLHLSKASTPAIAPIIPVPPDESVTTSEMVVNLDEEIRFFAYELFLKRYGQNGDDVNDWYRAVMEICGRYDASGYQTYKSEGSWWAKKTIVLHNKPAH